MSNVRRGRVKWYDCVKGYGFLVNPEGEDVFFHWSALPGEQGKNRVFPNDTVLYEEHDNSGKLKTSNIISVSREKEM